MELAGYFLIVEKSKDPLITKCLSLLTDPEFLSCHQYPSDSSSLVEAPKLLIHQEPALLIFSLPLTLCQSLSTRSTVPSGVSVLTTCKLKFKYIVALENNFCVWNRLLSGLPAGQLSFLICARTDCLPNLCHWRYFVCRSYPLWNSPSPTTIHTLQKCLSQGQYTWRHDSILSCLISSVRQKFLLSSNYMLTYLASKLATHFQQPYQLTTQHLLLDQTWFWSQWIVLPWLNWPCP